MTMLAEHTDNQTFTITRDLDKSHGYPLYDLYNSLLPGSWIAFAHRLGIAVKDLEGIAERGMTHREADLFAVRCGYVPYIIWPRWLDDDTLDAMYDPSPPCHFEYSDVAYVPGGLKRAILEIAKIHLNEPISPASVAHSMRRSYSPGIWVQMKNLAKSGYLTIYTDSPARYILRDPECQLDKQAGTFLVDKKAMVHRTIVMHQINKHKRELTCAAAIAHELGGPDVLIYDIVKELQDAGWLVATGGGYFTVARLVGLETALGYVRAFADEIAPFDITVDIFCA